MFINICYYRCYNVLDIILPTQNLMCKILMCLIIHTQSLMCLLIPTQSLSPSYYTMLECPCLAITVSTMSSSPRPSSSMMPCSSHRPPWSLKVSTSKTRMPFLNFVSLAGHHSQQYEATFPGEL